MKKILELGAGKNIYKPKHREIVIHHDRVKLPHIEAVHDLNKFPYPFKDSEFEVIIANHVLEHLDDVIRVLKELHRITKPNGIIKVRVPFFADAANFSDPTHKHNFTHLSFDVLEKDHYASYYSDVHFKIIKREYTFHRFLLKKFISPLANRFKGFYLLNLPYIFPAAEIYFELKVLK